MRTTGISIVLFFQLCIFTGYSQISGSFEIGSGYDDNAFSNVLASESSYGSAALSLGYFPDASPFAVSYSGLFATFGAFPDRQYSTHSLIGSYEIPYGSEKIHSITLAGSYTLRTDTDVYEYYDYNQAIAYIALRHYFSQTFASNLGYTLKYRKYANFDDMSYLEHVGWITGNTSFESRTSITLRGEIAIKNYSSVSTNAADPGTSTTSGLTGDGLTIEGNGPGGSGNGGNGNGNSGSNGQGSASQNGGYTNQMGRRYSSIGETAQIITYDDATTSQLRLSATVGQGLTETTGLSITYLKRLHLTDQSRAIVGGTVEFVGEEELFDDPYSYESDEASLKITQILPASMRLQVGGFMLLKEYSYVSALDDLTSPLRNDKKYGGYISLSKSIGGNWLVFADLDLALGYTYIRNESNTTWYDYSANTISFSIGTSF